MATEITMPQMGADMTEGTIVRWLKSPGDEVERGEIIAEIETDKATVELEAFEGGVMSQILAQEGDVVPVGEAIALLAAPGEEVGDHKPAPRERPQRRIEPVTDGGGQRLERASETGVQAPAERQEKVEAGGEAPEPAPSGDGGQPVVATPEAAPPSPEVRLRASPVAKKIAEERGIDLKAIQGTGPDGRILRRDVEAAPKAEAAPRTEAPPAPARPTAAAPSPEPAAGAVPGQPVTVTPMRRAIARRMQASKQQAPHYYLTLDVDMTAALAFRRRANEVLSEEERISVNDLIVKACAVTLQRHPKFNATYENDAPVLHEAINIGIAIALEDGLIAPAILNCQAKGLAQIARETKSLSERARAGSVRQSEYTDGTFTVTNLGAFGVESLIGIINPPQTAILGVGSVMEKPVAREGQVVVRQMMTLALSGDHRVTDGAEGARFLKDIDRALEDPAFMVL